MEGNIFSQTPACRLPPLPPQAAQAGNSSALADVRWKRAHYLSIRVTGPIAKTSPLIRRKRRSRGAGFAATRCANGRWHNSHPPAVNRGRPRRCVRHKPGRQPPCPLFKEAGKNEIFSSGCKVKTLPRGTGGRAAPRTSAFITHPWRADYLFVGAVGQNGFFPPAVGRGDFRGFRLANLTNSMYIKPM